MRHWRNLNLVSLLLLPLAGLFWLAATVRRRLYLNGWLETCQVGVPVIVVGNITAGGTGKTPLVIALVKALQRHGFRPGVVSRGYGGAQSAAQFVTANSNPAAVGDEPVLIAWKTSVPVVVGRDRVAAARLLLARSPGVDVILSDDGLQHYRLGRRIELAVVDGATGLGNGLLMPAGPLREPESRLKTVDAVLITHRHGQEMIFRNEHQRVSVVNHGPGALYRLENSLDRRALDNAFSERVDAVAGIAHPENFFSVLRNAGLDIRTQAYADHHDFTISDLPAQGTLIMTEKDAVKCRTFARPDWWALEWNADPDPTLIAWLAEAITQPSNNDISAIAGIHG